MPFATPKRPLQSGTLLADFTFPSISPIAGVSTRVPAFASCCRKRGSNNFGSGNKVHAFLNYLALVSAALPDERLLDASIGVDESGRQQQPTNDRIRAAIGVLTVKSYFQ